MRKYVLIFSVLFFCLTFFHVASAGQVLVQKGSQGKVVQTVQSLLLRHGYFTGRLDGVARADTISAIQAFQRAHSLPATGYCDEETFAAMSGGETYTAQKNYQDYYSAYQKSLPPPAIVPSAPEAVTTYDIYGSYWQDNNESYYIDLVNKGQARIVFVEATAYTSQDPGCDNYTYTGKFLQHGIVAVDPRFIPLGTEVYVPGYGKAVAEDIGGDIQNNRIDLAFETRDAAFRFGRQFMNIYVVN